MKEQSLSKALPLREQDPNWWASPSRRLLARLQLTAWRIWTLCKRVFKPHLPVPLPTPPDPAERFAHPGNQALFTYLRGLSSLATADADPVWRLDGYKVRTHPDLIGFLYSLTDPDQAVRGSAYGVPVMANAQGLVFAWAGGTHDIFIRLRPEHHASACGDNGRFDPTYGQDWIEFHFGGLKGSPPDWRGSIQHWIGVSYRESGKTE